MRLLWLDLVLLCAGLSQAMNASPLNLPTHYFAICRRLSSYSEGAQGALLQRYPICCYYPPLQQNSRIKKQCKRLVIGSGSPSGSGSVDHHVIVPVETEDMRTQLNDTSKKAPEIIEVTCCNSGKTKTCGKGIGCMDVCDDTGKQSHRSLYHICISNYFLTVDVVDLTDQENEACSPVIREVIETKPETSPPSCPSKYLYYFLRSASSSPSSRRALSLLNRHILCCFHPLIKKVEVYRQLCTRVYNPQGNNRAKRATATANLASWKLSWCPRQLYGGTNGMDRDMDLDMYEVCCFHPICRGHRPVGKKCHIRAPHFFEDPA